MGGSRVNPREWRQGETVSGLAQEANVRCVFVGPSEYAGSGFTEVIMERAEYVAARTISERLEATLELLSERELSLVYCYIPELDQVAHAYGVDSAKWLLKTEELNASMLQFSSGMPSHSGAILTADHGIVDVPASNHIFLDDLINVDLLSITGDPRCQFIYLSDPSQSSHLVESLNQQLGGRAIAVPKSSILDQGLCGERVTEEVGARMPELFVIAVKNCALYHRNFASPKSMNMVGQHGGLSDVELMVPLLKFGAYA